MKKFIGRLAAVMVAVVMMAGLVPVVEVRADGMAGCGQMTIAAGFSHSLAILPDGNLWAWGNKIFVQLGDGTTIDSHNPVRIMDNVSAVSAGIGHSIAIRTDGSLWAWGWNYLGQLGDGTTIGRHSPVRIMDNILQPCRVAEPQPI